MVVNTAMNVPMTITRVCTLMFSAATLMGQIAVPQSDENDPDLPRLVCRMALFAQQLADLPGAEKLARHGLALFARSDSLETADGAACLTTYATLSEAKGLIREAISIWERTGGPDDPSLAGGLLNLGILLQARKQYDEAERVLARARRIDEKALPPNHPRIAMDLNAAGVLATARKNYREAEQLLLRSLAILEGAQSSQRAETGQVLLNLAEVYRLEKKLDQSRDAFQRGLAAVTLSWGPNDPRLAQWMESLAGVLRAVEDYAGAEELEIRATRIRVLHAI